MNDRVESGSRRVTIRTWEPEHRSFHVDAGPDTNLRVRTYFYPRWTAGAEGRVLVTSATSDGLLQVSAPARAIDIDLTFERPASRLFEMIATVSWALIIGAFMFWMIKNRRSTVSNDGV